MIYQFFGVTLDLGDIFQDCLDLLFLGLEFLDDLVDSLKVLVSIDVFWHFLPLSVHISEGFFLVLKLCDRFLNFFLEAFDFVDFVLVFHFCGRDVLFLGRDLVGDGLFVFVPLFLEVVKLFLEILNLGPQLLNVLSP